MTVRVGKFENRRLAELEGVMMNWILVIIIGAIAASIVAVNIDVTKYWVVLYIMGYIVADLARAADEWDKRKEGRG